MRVLYLIGGSRSENLTMFRDRVLSFAEKQLSPLAEETVVAVTEEPPPRFSVIPFRRETMSLVSLEGVDRDAQLPQEPEGFLGAFYSEAAFPVVHRQTWKNGERSPGAGLLTLFKKKTGLTDEEFLKRWYQGHTPLTLEVHPNVGYVRNRVTGTVALPDGTVFIPDGIVEEQYDPPADLVKPYRFFGGSIWKMLPTMIRVLRDVRGFIDYQSIRTWYTAEYRLPRRMRTS
jgi:hypothetical protein